MSRALRQTLERIALLVVGLILGCVLLGDSGQISDDEREASWVAGYRKGQADYYRALRKSELLRATPIAASFEQGAQ